MQNKIGKNIVLCSTHEYFEPFLSTATAMQIVFQQPVKQARLINAK